MAYEVIQKNYEQYLKVLGKLDESLHVEITSDLIRDGIIQRFEFTLEVLWKLIKRIAQTREIEVFGPKDAFKAAFQLGLIKPEEEGLFVEMVKQRNLTSYTYNEKVAIEIFEFIKTDGIKAFKIIEKRIKEYLK